MNYEFENGIEDLLDPLQEKKMKRLRAIMDYLKGKKEIEVKEFCGFFCINFGLHRRTLWGYLEELQDAGLILINGDKIQWLGEEPNEED